MSKNLLDLSVLDIDINSLLISLNPPLPNLSMDDVKLTLNDVPFTSFNLHDESSGLGGKYKIIPLNSFNPNDFISLQIINDNYDSNKFKLCFSKYFVNRKADLSFKLPDNKSGTYKFKIVSINGEEFNIESEPFIICRDINTEDSSISLKGSGIYYENQDIVLDINLKTIDDENVPDGYYLIKINQTPMW
ncbi:hypothetical protein [Clostridium lundense]|uniref:hypothetical protein n=1 Tax=Clostridium lundense TaxID=319475 RepID=UPI0004863E0F|nr:hypothetical protein [Clostridium lundense]